MKKTVLWALAVVFVGGLVGCGKSSTSSAPAPAGASDSTKPTPRPAPKGAPPVSP